MIFNLASKETTPCNNFETPVLNPLYSFCEFCELFLKKIHLQMQKFNSNPLHSLSLRMIANDKNRLPRVLELFYIQTCICGNWVFHKRFFGTKEWCPGYDTSCTVDKNVSCRSINKSLYLFHKLNRNKLISAPVFIICKLSPLFAYHQTQRRI